GGSKQGTHICRTLLGGGHTGTDYSCYILSVGGGQEPESHHHSLQFCGGPFSTNTPTTSRQAKLAEGEDKQSNGKNIKRRDSRKSCKKSGGKKNVVTGAQKDKAQSEFNECIGFKSPFAQPDPQQTNNRGQENNEECPTGIIDAVRIQSQQVFVQVLCCEDTQRATGLFVYSPEDDGEHDKYQRGPEFLAF